MPSVMFAVALLGCGGSDHHTPDGALPDAPPDTPSSTTLTINAYRSTGGFNAQLMAVQDGDGPWTVLTGTAGVYTTTLHSDRYGVMTSCASTTFSGPSIWYAAISDGTTLYLGDCSEPGPAAATVSGNVTGANAANPTRVTDISFAQADLPAGTTAYTLDTVVGPDRLFAAELVGQRPIKLAVADTTIANGATLDFDLAAGFAPETHALTASGTIVSATGWYRDTHGIARLDRVSAPVTDYRALPADKLGTGLNRLIVTADNGSQVIRYFKTPVDQHVTFLPAYALATQPTATATPYPNVTFTFPLVAGTSLYDLSFSTTNQTTFASVFWSAEMTGAWMAKAFPGATSVTYTMPDFHNLAGWQTAFQAEAGSPLDWSVGPSKQTNIDWAPTVPPNTLFDHDGGELTFATASGTLPAP